MQLALVELATELGHLARDQELMITSAESCTGGLIAWALTQTAGSSQWFERGFVTYSNAAKEQSIGVPAALIELHGAVSEAVAQAMALGCLGAAHNAQIALSVTGIAGPTGATPGKPVGTVCFGWALRGAKPSDVAQSFAQTLYLTGDRGEIREQAAKHSIGSAIGYLRQAKGMAHPNTEHTAKPFDNPPAAK